MAAGLDTLYERSFRLWNSLDDEVQDRVWYEIGGPATDALEQAAQALADRLRMKVDQAAMLIFGTLLQRLGGRAQLPQR